MFWKDKTCETLEELKQVQADIAFYKKRKKELSEPPKDPYFVPYRTKASVVDSIVRMMTGTESMELVFRGAGEHLQFWNEFGKALVRFSENAEEFLSCKSNLELLYVKEKNLKEKLGIR